MNKDPKRSWRDNYIPNLADEHEEMVRAYWYKRGTLTGTVIGLLVGLPLCFIQSEYPGPYVLAVMSSIGGYLGWMYMKGRIG